MSPDPGPSTEIRLDARACRSPTSRPSSHGDAHDLTKLLLCSAILRRTSPAARSFVLALLRALHLDPRLRSAVPSQQQAAADPTKFLVDPGIPPQIRSIALAAAGCRVLTRAAALPPPVPLRWGSPDDSRLALPSRRRPGGGRSSWTWPLDVIRLGPDDDPPPSPPHRSEHWSHGWSGPGSGIRATRRSCSCSTPATTWCGCRGCWGRCRCACSAASAPTGSWTAWPAGDAGTTLGARPATGHLPPCRPGDPSGARADLHQHPRPLRRGRGPLLGAPAPQAGAALVVGRPPRPAADRGRHAGPPWGRTPAGRPRPQAAVAVVQPP
jgi:hypothetical protein